MNKRMDSREQQFHEAMLGLYWRTGKACGYWGTRFLQMVRRRGGVEAAKQLLRRNGFSKGFEKLREVGRLDLSVEALVVDPKWQSLFTEDEVAIARQKLE